MKYYLRKFGFYLVAFIAALTLNFAIPRMLPGDPVDIVLNRLASKGTVQPETRAAIESMLGQSDGQPLWEQYITYVKNIFTGNWGTSVAFFPTPVLDVIKNALPWTICLVGITTILSFILHQIMGIGGGWRHGKKFDSFIVPVSTVFQSVPYFWLALIFVSIFAKNLGWFPLSGGYDYQHLNPVLSPMFVGSLLHYAFLPALTILVSSFGAGVVGMRNMMVSTLSEDYIVTAEAKGLSNSRIKWGYAARNAVLPSVSGFAVSLGNVVGGSLLTETVFSYPGIGQQLLMAVQNNDYALMQGIFMIITTSVLVVNFIVDILYGFIDPRTRQTD